MDPAPSAGTDARAEASDPVLARAARVLDLTALSGAERRVLSLALTGMSVRDITEQLVLSEPTVRGHLGRIYGKLGVTGRVDLLARVAAEAARDDPLPQRADGEPNGPPRSETPVALVLMGGLVIVVLLSIAFPPAMLLTGPALVFGGWRFRRSSRSGVLAFAGLWVLLVGVVLSLFGLILLLGVIGLLATGSVSQGP